MTTLRQQDRRNARVALAVCLLLDLAMSLAMCGRRPAPALAQASQSPRSPAETLAALCVNEAGWDHPRDCAGIYAVLANQGEAWGVSWLTFASWYSRRFFSGTGANPWTAALRDSEAYPEGLGTTWTREREGGLASRYSRFHFLVDFCADLLQSPPVCPAMDWGSAEDVAHGRFARAHAHDVFVDCTDGEEAVNLFMRPPDRPEADPD